MTRNNAELVSIVVPVYNIEQYLGACVSSLRAQTHDQLEIILVNDGSTDVSGSMCDELADTDSRIRVIHQVNGGLSAARNSGLQVATGQFIAFIDGDDWVETHMVDEMVSTALETNADIVVAGSIVDVIDNTGQLASSTLLIPDEQVLTPDTHGVVMNQHFLGLLGYAWNKLYRRDLLTTPGLTFEPGLSLIEDIDFNARALTLSTTVAVTPNAYVHYIQRPRATLGTRHYPDFLDLRLRAIEGLDRILTHWNVDSATRQSRLDVLRHAAIRNVVRRTNEHPTWAPADKRAHLSDVLQQARRQTPLRLDVRTAGFPVRGFTWLLLHSPPALALKLDRIVGGLRRLTTKARRLKASTS